MPIGNTQTVFVSMEIIETPIVDCYLIRNKRFGDSRGYFFESFNHRAFSQATGWEGQFVQDNQSQSHYGVVRGLHFQEAPHAQAKLVRVLQGRVLDVALDLRPGSPSFGRHFSVELSDDNAEQLFVPRGCAHGFSVLTEAATFFYKCDNYYNKAAEGGIHPLDPALGIAWQLPMDKIVLSEKDRQAPDFASYLQARNSH